MTDRHSPTEPTARREPGMREFIALMAALMAANALAIDTMLPALPEIGRSLGVHEDNRRQLVVTVYLLGFGGAQLVYGPLADRFGRRPLLLLSLAFYVGFTFLAASASSFVLFLAARAMAGIAAAGPRVLVVSVVRDRFQGPQMARIMSFAFLVFMLVPILAPSIGQVILWVADWRAIFGLLALYGLVVLVWTTARLPESLQPERRRPLSFAKVKEAAAITLSHRMSIGNTLALMLMSGGLFTLITSIQQIVFDVFKQPQMLAIVFASIAGVIALSSFLNTTMVMRFGSRRIMIAGLWFFSTAAALHLAIGCLFGETLLSFIILQGLTMAGYGLISSNLSAVAMEPLGHVAGTAASIQGVITTVGGALIGFGFGQLFNGTTLPLLASFTICGFGALAMATWANRLGPGEAA